LLCAGTAVRGFVLLVFTTLPGFSAGAGFFGRVAPGVFDEKIPHRTRNNILWEFRVEQCYGEYGIKPFLSAYMICPFVFLVKP